MFLRFQLLFLTCALVCVPFLRAQEEDVLRPHGRPLTDAQRSAFSWTNHPEKVPIALGIYGGININSFSQNVEYALQPRVDQPLETVLTTGSGTSLLLGALLDYTVSPTVAVQLRLEYDAKNFSNSQRGAIDAVDQNSFAFTAPVTAQYTWKVNALNIEPTVRVNLDEHLFLSLGIPIALQMGDWSRTDVMTFDTTGVFWTTTYGDKTYLLSDSLTSMSRVVNQGNQITPAAANADVGKANTLRIGVVPGVGYLVPINRSMALALELRYQYMLTALHSDFVAYDYVRLPTNITPTEVDFSKAMLNSLQLTVGLWFKL